MDGTLATAALCGLGAVGIALAALRTKSRLDLTRAKHGSVGGHARIAHALAKQLPAYSYEDAQFFKVDGAPETVAGARRADFERLGALFRSRAPRTLQLTQQASAQISDLQFVDAYRVPFQFSSYVQQHLPATSFVGSSCGVTVADLDGNEFYDLAGSYGVNLFGYDFYKDCIARAVEDAGPLGPVLGPYHPIVADNAARLLRISGMDEVSFHMSGTEAVMQAVRLARYHTGRTHLVRFCGAYHGWWGDVQPGPGNPMPARETYTLKDMSEATLRVLRGRKDIACVLVNPVQLLHPNQSAPADSTLVDSSRRSGFDRAGYSAWLKQLRAVCSERGIVLIFDEVFVGFRLAPGSAQEYFGVEADLVTYGKTLGGGLPIGAVCGRRRLMKRFRDNRPADICFARGTFNSHPYVMAAANRFLRHLETPSIAALYNDLDELWNERARQLNAQLQDAGLPVRVTNLSSIWVIWYTQPSTYNWMFQYYLRAEGLALSWIGTGRLIFSLNYTDADFAAVADRFVAAAQAMQQAGWWWNPPLASNKKIRRRILREILSHRLLPRGLVTQRPI